MVQSYASCRFLLLTLLASTLLLGIAFWGDAVPVPSQEKETTLYRTIPLSADLLDPQQIANRLNQEFSRGWEFAGAVPLSPAQWALVLQARPGVENVGDPVSSIASLWVDYDPGTGYLLVNGTPILSGQEGLLSAFRRYRQAEGLVLRLRREVPAPQLATIFQALYSLDITQVTLQFP